MNSTLQPCQLFGISSHVGAIVRSLLFTALSLVVTNTLAWGTEGHQVIAAIAQSQLTTKARTEVNRLLALEPGETLQSISTWPDEHRGAATGSWHYVNFPRETCTFDAGRDCPDDGAAFESRRGQVGGFVEYGVSIDFTQLQLKRYSHGRSQGTILARTF